MSMSNTLQTVSIVDRYTLSTLSEQRWLIVFGRSPVIRASSRCERSRSFKIFFSLTDIGMVFSFLFLQKQVYDLQSNLRKLQENGLPLYPSQGATVELWERKLKQS
jgi:hypothetical protein